MTAVINQQIEDAPVDSLLPHPDNPRQGDVDAIEESILANGWYGAVIVQLSTRFILAGNHRWQGAKRAGALTVPTIFVDVDDATARRIILADNRTADRASYDQESLTNILTSIQQEAGNLAGTGYVDSDLKQMMESLKAVQEEAANGTGQKTKPAKPTKIVIGPYQIKVDPNKLADLFQDIKETIGGDSEGDIIAECRRRLKL